MTMASDDNFATSETGGTSVTMATQQLIHETSSSQPSESGNIHLDSNPVTSSLPLCYWMKIYLLPLPLPF